MAYTAVGMPTSPVTMDITKEQNGLRRSHSGKDLRTQSIIRRSYSDNHLCCRSINRIQATSSVQPKLRSSSNNNNNKPFQFSGSILPNSLSSFLFDQQTSSNKGEKDVNIEENMVESGTKERANWVERLMEIKKHWKNRLPRESMDMDVMSNNYISDECDCDDDNVCEVDYEEENGQEVTYDSDLFSKFLAQVSWSDTKLYSQLAFLCNMAYVIPQIKVRDHRCYNNNLSEFFSRIAYSSFIFLVYA